MFLDEMISSSNMSFGLYPGLTSNAIDAIEKSASEEIKNLYLPKLSTGQWSGTMNLTEPHCCTDLGLTKTIAYPQEDGSYTITLSSDNICSVYFSYNILAVSAGKLTAG